MAMPHATAGSTIPNSVLRKTSGVVTGINNRLVINERTFPQSRVGETVKRLSGNVLKISRNGGKGVLRTVNSDTSTHDRLDLPQSEPAITIRSKQGFKGKINFDTPTIVAPIARMAFAGGGVDSVPTVTPMTASQSRIASSLQKKRLARRAGRHFTSPYQTPALYDRSAPESAQYGPCRIGSRRKRGKRDVSGNMRNSNAPSSDKHVILEPPNQEDVDITSIHPNPMDPLPPNDPIEQQGNQFANYHGNLREPMKSKNFPTLEYAKRAGMERRMIEKDARGGKTTYPPQGSSSQQQ